MFRVPKGHDGEGVVCPCCQRILRLPETGDQAPPLVVPVDPVKEEKDTRKSRKVRKKRRQKPTDEEWQPDKAEIDSSEGRRGNVIWQLVAGAVLFVATILVIVWAMRTQQNEEPAEALAIEAQPMVPEDPALSEEGAEKVELWFDKDEVEKLLKALMEAKTVEKILPLVRNRVELEEKIRAYHGRNPLVAKGFKRWNLNQVFQDDAGNALSLSVVTNQFDAQWVSVVETDEGPKVDWESWVGAGDLSWEELMKTKPSEPILMRVILGDVNYYNMLYSDDQEWKSLRLASPDGDQVIYGYVRLRSELADQLARLFAVIEGGQCRSIVRISYPEGAVGASQVEIQELVSADWFLRGVDDE